MLTCGCTVTAPCYQHRGQYEERRMSERRFIEIADLAAAMEVRDGS